MQTVIETYTFSSAFDSGNLAQVTKVKSLPGSTEHFAIWTRNDCQGTCIELLRMNILPTH